MGVAPLYEVRCSLTGALPLSGWDTWEEALAIARMATSCYKTFSDRALFVGCSDVTFPSFLQFDNEISKDLRPRLERTGDQDLLQTFLDYFSGKSFQVGTSLLALWESVTPLVVANMASVGRHPLSSHKAS